MDSSAISPSRVFQKGSVHRYLEALRTSSALRHLESLVSIHLQTKFGTLKQVAAKEKLFLDGLCPKSANGKTILLMLLSVCSPPLGS